MFIVSIGEAFPVTSITNDLLIKFQPELGKSECIKQSGIDERRSVLPIDYIRNGQYSPKEAYKVMLESPSELAFRAAQLAIDRAGINAQQIGLVIGDCTTPIQVTPSEGQRVASKLELKVPAYDISGAQGAFILHVNTLASWKEEKVPDYVLCITTHTPTGSINYKEGVSGVLFGDGAAAYILSTKISGKFLVQNSSFEMDCSKSSSAYVDHYGFSKIPNDYTNIFIRDSFIEAVSQLVVNKQNTRRFFIGPQCDIPFVRQTARDLGFDNDKILFLGDKFGETLGASLPATISKNWNLFQTNDEIYCVQAGLGLKHGTISLKVVN